MATQHYGFAAAAAGDGDLALWRLRPLGDDPVAAYRAAAECVLAALAVARAVPGGKARLEPGAAFAPQVAWLRDSPLDQVVALLGRSPDWQPPTPALFARLWFTAAV